MLSLLLAGPAIAQERTTTAEHVRAILDDLRDWPPDAAEIPRKAARKWGKYKGAREKYARLFAEGGALESIDFIDAFDGGDAYLVEFENPRLMVLYRREPKRRWRWRTMIRMPR